MQLSKCVHARFDNGFQTITSDDVMTKPERWNRYIAPILDKVANRLERKLRILYPSNEEVEKSLRRTEFISTMNDIRNEAFDAFGYGDVELTKHKIDKKTGVLGI